ncbi:MAG TPA: hypothetical protein VJ183_04870 [Chloroflexia bacterium]|nr:hypothetical protein [Chloroflexia bacterium]
MRPEIRKARFALLGLVVLLLGLTGCGDDASTASLPAVPVPTEAPLAEGWTRHVQAEDGFSIALAPYWDKVDLDPSLLESTLDQLKDSNPKIGQLLSKQVTSLVSSGVKFWAFDQGGNVEITGFATNLNVIVQPLPSAMSLDDFVKETISQVDQFKQMLAGPVTHQRVTLSSGDAEKIVYHMRISVPGVSEAIQTTTTQYAVVDGARAYILTFSALAVEADKYASTFAKMARTFRIVK